MSGHVSEGEIANAGIGATSGSGGSVLPHLMRMQDVGGKRLFGFVPGE